MSGVNQITIVGRAGTVPDLRISDNNTPYCRFSVAVNEQWTKDGERKETVTWFPVCLQWIVGGNSQTRREGTAPRRPRACAEPRVRRQGRHSAPGDASGRREGYVPR